jgi:hypothetical protein
LERVLRRKLPQEVIVLSEDLLGRIVKFLQETDVPEGTESEANAQEKLHAVLHASCDLSHADAEPLRRYIERLGLSEVLQRSLNVRCHPGLLCSEVNANGERAVLDPCPVMLAPLVSLDEELVGVHALYLTQDGTPAALTKPEKTWIAGQFRHHVAATGAAVRLLRPGRALSITLGVENGWAIAVATGQPVWVGTSPSVLEFMQLPTWVREVHCWGVRDPLQLQADGTFRSPALLAAQRLVRRMRNQGRAAQFVPPPVADGRNVSWHEAYRAQGRAAFPPVRSVSVPLPSAQRLNRERLPESGAG